MRTNAVMKRTLLTLVLLVPACDKQDKSTTPPDDPGTTAATETEPTSEPAEVEQEPDPPEIDAGSHQYLVGQYDDAIALLGPVFEDLKSRHQSRASGLAAGWLALAHAQLVFEDAEPLYKHALAMSERTADPEVAALAQLAHGAFLLGREDYTAAKQAFEAASRAAPKSLPAAIANILRAETLIGSAYGSGASETIERPQDLETAKQAYAAAAETAQAGIEPDVVMGRVEEGLAAIAKFQGDKENACKHATAAVQHLETAQASDFLIEGPRRIVQDFRCE